MKFSNRFVLLISFMLIPNLSFAGDCDSGRSAQITAKVMDVSQVIENGHDKVCLISLNLTQLSPNVLCPLLPGDLELPVIAEALVGASLEDCDRLGSRIGNEVGGYLLLSNGATRPYFELAQ